MKLKSIIIGMIFSVVSFAFVGVANAVVNWEPLVKIPGIPVTGVNLSVYLIGIYNFLLSIVGIVAVMMLIVGGMRYITAAGNSAAIADAKDIITNAIVGLLLALLTWVFIATINPDALYLKKPGSTFTTALPVGPDAGACYNNFVLPDVCTCADLVVITSSNVGDCLSDCRTQGHCITPPGSCIRKEKNFPTFDINTECYCIDGVGEEVVKPDAAWFAGPPPPEDLNCDYVCSHPAAAADGNYHGVKIALYYGTSVLDLREIVPGDARINIKRDVEYIFDLSKSSDCRYGFTHFALHYNGKPGLIGGSTLWCCELNSACGGGWGTLCNLGGFTCDGSQPPGLDGYPAPMDKNTFNSVTAPVTALGFYQIWVGVSLNDGAACTEFEKLFDVNIID